MADRSSTTGSMVPRAFGQEPEKIRTSRKEFCCFSCYNIFRYMIIGTLLVWANEINVNHNNKYKKYCCSCYYISLDPTSYALEEDTRFDLSYCIPSCTDCNFCETYFNHSAEKAFAYNNNHCPIKGYTKPKSDWSKNWHKETGCPQDNIGLTSMQWLSKSYVAYAVVSVIGCSVYILFLTGLLITDLHALHNSHQSSLKMIYIYNIIVSEICLYAIFKPFQYWDNSIAVDDGTTVICQVDAIGHTMERIFGVVIFTTVILVAIHALYIIMNACYVKGCCKCGSSKKCCCCKCTVTHKQVHNQYINMDESKNKVNNNQLDQDVNVSINSFSQFSDLSTTSNQSGFGVSAIKKCCCCRFAEIVHKVYLFFAWIIVCIFVPLGAICCIFSIVKMIIAGVNNDYLDDEEQAMVYIVSFLIVISSFDIFIWFKCFYNNELEMTVSDFCVVDCNCFKKAKNAAIINN